VTDVPEERKPHEWIEVGARRWCIACRSYQICRNGRWFDSMVGPWPAYARTDVSKHTRPAGETAGGRRAAPPQQEGGEVE
jgi:hypothetical protein